MLMYNLIEYSDNYSKTSGSLWQYCKDIPAVNNNGDIVIFNGANDTDSLNFKSKIIGKTNDDGDIENVEIMVPLKYLSNFWRTLEMPLINCEVELIINTNVANQNPTFTITETNLYLPVVTLSTQDNGKLLPQLKSGFKRTLNWNKYLAKPELLTQSVMINEKSFFDQPIKDNKITYGNIRKITTRQGDYYTAGCLLDYIYSKNYYKMIAVDLSKQKALLKQFNKLILQQT